MNFSTKLRYLMTREGLTQDALSEQLEVSNATVWKWLTGSVPRAQMAQSLADFFEVDVNDLLDDTREILNKNSGPLTDEEKRIYHSEFAEVTSKIEVIMRDQVDKYHELMKLYERKDELFRKITSDKIGESVAPLSPSEPEFPKPAMPLPPPPKKPGKSSGVKV